MSKHPAPRYQAEKRTGELRIALPAGDAIFRRAWRWCGLCAQLWADWDDKSLHRCTCSSSCLKEFHDQNAVKAAHAIGGDPAVHEIEQVLYIEHKYYDLIDHEGPAALARLLQEMRRGKR